MRHIQTMTDFEQYGIIWLTGEACPYGMRVLFDLTAQGRKLICSFLGISPAALVDAWNPGAPGDPLAHVASIRLAPETMQYLGAFILLQDPACRFVIVHPRRVLGIMRGDDFDDAHTDDEVLAEVTRLYGKYDRSYRAIPGQPQRDGNAVHAMSGRSL